MQNSTANQHAVREAALSQLREEDPGRLLAHWATHGCGDVIRDGLTHLLGSAGEQTALHGRRTAVTQHRRSQSRAAVPATLPRSPPNFLYRPRRTPPAVAAVAVSRALADLPQCLSSQGLPSHHYPARRRRPRRLVPLNRRATSGGSATLGGTDLQTHLAP